MTKKEVYLVYETDAWLDARSMVLMGIFENLDDAINNIIEEMSMALVFDTPEQAKETADELKRYLQTQGFDTNYVIETATLNEWGEI